MKKILIALILISLVLPVAGLADIEITNPLKATTTAALIDSIIDFIFNVSLLIAPLMIIVAGFYFVTAVGDPERIKTAQNIITWALVGFTIILLAKGLITLLRNILGVQVS